MMMMTMMVVVMMKTRGAGMEEELQPCHPSSKLGTRNWSSCPDDDEDDDDDDDDDGDDSDVYDYNEDESSLMFDIEVDIPPLIEFYLYIASESSFSIVSISSCNRGVILRKCSEILLEFCANLRFGHLMPR